MNAAQAISRAAPPTNMFILVSLFVIERSRALNMTIPRGLRSRSHAESHFEQLGTEGEASSFGTGQINLKPHLVSCRDELDHAAAAYELRHITDGQNAGLIQRCEDFFKPLFLGRTNEQDLATASLLQRCNTSNYDLFGIDAFACD